MRSPRIARLRSRLSYANVTATLALFIALGGTSYAAVTLPKNSVGHSQIKKNAVRSGEIRSKSIRLSDISTRTRSALGGQAGPPGPQGPAGPPAVSEHVQVDSGGGSKGTGSVTHTESNIYTAIFKRDVSACAYGVSLVAAQNGPVFEEPPAGRITAASAGGPNVTVKTFDAAGNPSPLPFHLIVAC